MSSLTTLEKRYFEDLLGMSGGYVLDFSNSTFSAFFRECLNIDIYSSKYENYGDSKAKRMRSFWETEPDIKVGKALNDLLDVWAYENPEKVNTEPKLPKCKEIIARLTGATVKKEPTENDFLKQNIELPKLTKLGLDHSVIDILNKRLKEVDAGLKVGNSLSVIFMCGSILEGILLGTATQNAEKFNRAKSSPKDKDGKVKSFPHWSLAQFIDTAYELKLIKLDVKKFSHELRDFRNYIHPYEQMASGFHPNNHTAEICFQVLKAAIADLGGER